MSLSTKYSDPSIQGPSKFLLIINSAENSFEDCYAVVKL